MKFIKEKNKFLATGLSLISLLFLYLDIFYWQETWFGVLLFITFLFSVSWFWSKILLKSFRIKNKFLENKILSLFSAFLLLGFILAIFIVFYKADLFVQWSSYALCFFLSYIIYLWSVYGKQKIYKNKIKKEVSSDIFFVFGRIWFLKIMTFLFICFGFVLLYFSKSVEVLWSPWQTINNFYLPLFFIITFLLGVLIFSKTNIKSVLFLIILYSFLLHSYLPLSHAMPWGGDIWRLQGVEQKLLSGEFHPPVLIGEEARWREVVGADLPEVFLVPQKYTYAHFWSSSVLLAGTLNIDLISVSKWLLPVIWSFLVPVLLFRLGHLLFRNWRSGLVLAWLSALPFPLQVLGALSLPVGLGFVVFLFILALWLQFFQEGGKKQLLLAAFFTFLMLFGYSLHFLLILFLLGFFILFGLIKKIASDTLYMVSKILLLLSSILVIPVLEVITKISFFPEKINFLEKFIQLGGIFSGWYYASAIRAHDIAIGNILFNHTPNYAFVPSIFTDWRYFVIPLLVVIWILVFVGLYHIVVNRQALHWFAVANLFFLCFGAYIIGWFVLDGDRLFTRRLDHLLSFLIILILTFSFFIINKKFSSKFKHSIKYKGLILSLIIILSFFTTTTYASGPDIRVVSQEEFQAASYLVESVDLESKQYCVLADTWELLVVEGLSGAKIVGGGFPMDYQFGQPERVELFGGVINKPKQEFISRIFELTGAKKCFFVVDIDELSSVDKIEEISDIIKTKPILISGHYLWNIEE